MEELKVFLETSSIHGLHFVGTTHKYARIFWMTVVLTGFILASSMIQRSLDSWERNPISTTIEILPISKTKFPKVTVCPPKYTYTDLNFELSNIGYQTIDSDLANENTTGYKLLESFSKYFFDEDFKRKLEKIESFNELRKYENWYKGQSLALVPTNDKLEINKGIITKVTKVDFDVTTKTINGEISTPFFGEDFEIEKFELGVIYNVHLRNPYKETANGTIVLKLYYDSLQSDYECLSLQGYSSLGFGSDNCLASNETYREIEIENFVGTTIKFERKGELTSVRLQTMKTPERNTGFKVTWKYREYSILKVEQGSLISQNKDFIAMTNLVKSVDWANNGTALKKFWSTASQVKADWFYTLKDPESNGYFCIREDDIRKSCFEILKYDRCK